MDNHPLHRALCHIATKSTARSQYLKAKTSLPTFPTSTVLAMNIHFRDAPPTIIHVDEQVIRAGKGVSDLFARPSCVSRQEVVVVTPPSHHPNLVTRLLLYPFSAWTHARWSYWTTDFPQTLSARYAVPRTPSNGDVNMEEKNGESSSTSSWIAGDAIDSAEAGDDFEGRWEVRWPFRPSKRNEDWEGREFVL